MNRIWAVSLVIVAFLALGAGTYWYFELRDEGVQVQTESPVVDAEKQEPTTIVSVEEPVIAPREIPREPEAIIPTDSPEPVDTLIEEAAEVALESEPVEITKPRIPTMPQPHPTLSLVAAGLLNLPSHVPSIPVPFAPPPRIEVQEEPITIEEPEELEPMVIEKVVEEPLERAQEEEPAIVEDLQVEEVKPVTLVPQVPSIPVIPTSRVEIDPRPLSWTVGSSVSITDFQWPKPVTRGFDVQLSLYRHTSSQFRYGAIFEFSKPFDDDEYQFSLLASVIYTFNEDKAFQFPITLALGPTLISDGSSSMDIALTAKAMAGVSYMLTEQLSIFYQAGLQTRWNFNKSTITFSLQPMRVGFNFSF